jgi:hypothetical protein
MADQDPKANYEFLRNWDESLTSTVLQKNGMDIRVAVYHYAGRQLERLCGATTDSREIVHAFHALLDPIPAGKGELTLVPGHQIVKLLFDISPMGWLSESIVATLHDAAASPVAARRVLIVFTEGMTGTNSTSVYNDIVDPALALSIPINPVILSRRKLEHITGAASPPAGALATVEMPRELADKPRAMGAEAYQGPLPWFTRVGGMTGGEAFVPPQLDREALAGILGLARDRVMSQYIVGFTLDAGTKPKKHSLEVTLQSKSAGKVIGGEKNGVY